MQRREFGSRLFFFETGNLPEILLYLPKIPIMFTGIVEATAHLKEIQEEGTNRHFILESVLDEPITIDQSIAHNGACLTVTEIFENNEQGKKRYSVTAVEETLNKTNLGDWKPGMTINLERCLKAGQRMDGHFVQGHVDTTGKVESIADRDGSWMLAFSFPKEYNNLLVDKGSICINGVSLTVVEATDGRFSVTIIPYTWEHTNFHTLSPGDRVNLEFDILGKYLLKAYGKAER